MALRTREEYIESLKQYKPKVHICGEKVDHVWESPYFKTSINQIAATYEFALDPEFREQSSVRSPLIDEDIPRNTLHIQQSMEDAVVKVRLTREVTKKRICTLCLSNFLSVTWAFIHDIDQKHGTQYHQRFKEYVKNLQKNDLRLSWGMMDPKGDRRFGPSKQDPPVDLRIVERNKDGIIVSGAKVHTTYGPVVHEVIAVPCRALSEDDRDYAVSFAVPVDAKGITFICRPAPGPRRSVNIESPLSSKFVGVEAMTIFDRVFVPWNRVFMCGEWDMCGNLPAYFAALHRQSKCACSAGHADLMIGTCSLLAKVNGLSLKVSHISDKITDMMMAAEVAYGCSLGSAMNGKMHPSGVWMPSALIANAGLHHIRSSLGSHIAHIHDIAGGLLTTMPTEADMENPETKDLINLYLRGSKDYTTEQRLRILELGRDLAASNLCGSIMGFTINAAGSPVTNKITVSRTYNLKEMEDIAREIACV